MRRPDLENVVLDSYAVLAFLFKGKGHEIVLGLLEKAMEADKKLLIDGLGANTRPLLAA